MARWRLIEPHYLYTDPPTLWVYNEVDRTTGRPIRREHKVPQYFHPESEVDWTEYDTIGRGERANGSVVVTDGKGNFTPKDIKFTGDPTPGMWPLDDEAKQISNSFADRWATPDKIWDMNAEGTYASRLVDNLVEQQDKVNMRLTELAQQRDKGFDQFIQSMTAMMQQNQQILMALTEKAMVKELGITQVVDTEEPLPPPDDDPLGIVVDPPKPRSARRA